MRMLVIAALLALSFAPSAAPEAVELGEVKIAKQYGLPYLPLMVMKSENLVEKHAGAAGLGAVKLTLVTVNGAAEAADVLLSNLADIIASGATVALLSGKSEVTAHFGFAPYCYEEMADPALHVVLKSYDVLGSSHMNGVLITTKRFHDNNPNLYAAIIAAQQEANAPIKSDPAKAAAIYLRLANDKKNSLEAMTRMVSDPDFDYTIVPLKVDMFVGFMHRVGRISAKPGSWQDLLFADIHDLPGS
jgi:ABC-type nitrate/sulfonate/bicarbonate transport system substrate-binding protein